MPSEITELNEEFIQDVHEESKETVSKRRVLLLFANRSKLESLRFFIV